MSKRNRSAGHPSPRARQHIVEALESRLMLHHGPPTSHYHFSWVGGSGSWSDPDNWVSDVPNPTQHPLPTANDTVTIASGTVTVNSNAAFHSGTIGADIRILGGVHVNIGSVGAVGAGLTLNGTMTVVGGSPPTVLLFISAATFGGSGTLHFDGGGFAQIGGGSTTPITLGSGLTVEGGTTHGGFGGLITSFADVIVQGAGISFGSGKFTNRGVIDVNGGRLRLDGPTWKNDGRININGGELFLAGTWRQSDLGTYTRTGGTVTAHGTLMGNLVLDGRSGSWNGGGTLVGGRFFARDGATFSGNSTYDNYILASDVTVSSGSVTIRNTLTLEGAKLRLSGVTATVLSSPTTGASANPAIVGTGTIELASGGTLTMFSDVGQVFTVGDTVSTRVISGTGSITGNVPWQKLVLRGPVSTTGSGQNFLVSVAQFELFGDANVVSGSNFIVQGPGPFGVFGDGSITTGARARLDSQRNLNIASSNKGRARAPGTLQITGGSSASPRLLEVTGEDRGPVPEGFFENFGYGVVRTGSGDYLRLVNNHDNSEGDEALYVDSLVMNGPGTIDLNGQKVYARAMETPFTTFLNGTVTLVPDGGPIPFALPTSGRISAAGQIDDWTFFGRAGQTVSAILNPGIGASASAPPPVNPTLTFGRLTLLSPTGASLGAGQSPSQHAIVTLSNIVLPEDGVYKLRAQSSLAQPNGTGHYKLSLYNVTAETRPLILNRATVGAIESPFATDRWTFSLSAGQQVQFDLLSADVNGLLFTLEGPDGYVAFSNLTNDSSLITVPPGRSGNYVLTVRASSDQTGRYSFMVRDGSVTPLALGVPFSGDLPGSGSPRWFKTTLPTPGQLLVTLDDASGADRNQLYIRRGALPTREVFDFRYESYDADEQIYIPNAGQGDWYILLYGDHVPAPSTYTLIAEYTDLRLTGNSPDRYGIDNTMTMTLRGGGFEPGTIVRLISGTNTITATTVEIDTDEQITATFDLTGAPQRTWDVRVERGTASHTLAGAFRTLPNLPARLETRLIMPSTPTPTSVTSGRIEYANTGNVAIDAPLMILQSADPQGEQFPILSLDMSRTIETFWSTDLPPGTSHRLMVLGSGQVPGVLGPGERMSVPFNHLGEKPPFDPDATLELELLCADHESEGDPIDWAALKSALRPPTVPAAIWDAVYAAITDPLDTVEDYAAMLVADVKYLGRLGLRVLDVDELWNFRVQQAMGTITAFPTISTSVDAQVPAPGEPLMLARVFNDGVIARNSIGPFGYGWASPWFAMLARDADGDVVTINSSSGGQRVFVRDSRGSTPLSPSAKYFSGTGDSSQLRRVSSAGAYELRDTSGIVTRFRPDGRIDYVQDANGNRTTAMFDNGKLVSLSHSSGGSISIGYNAAGRITDVTTSTGTSVSYTYDAAGEHLLSMTGEDGSTVHYTYDAGSANILRRHALLSEESGGSAQVFTYDQQGRIATTSAAGGVELVSVAYNSGRLSLTDGAGTSHLFFDHRNRLAKATNALGHNVVMRYDERNFLSSVTLPDGSTRRYTWCDCGSPVSSTDPNGHTVRYQRDPITRKLTSITDAQGNAFRLTYDGAANQLALIHANGSSEYAGNHTTSGLPQSFTTRAGHTAAFVYNAAGQVTRRTAPDGTFTDYGYDSRGRLTTITQGTQVTQQTYDTAVDGDRIKRVTYPDGKFVEYDYDDHGRLIALRDHTGHTTRYDYDAAGRLAGVRDTGGSALASYSYDAAGRLGRVDNGNNTFTTYGYDAAGNVLRIENRRSAGALNSSFAYTYDSRGRRTSATTPQGVWSYGYDANGQLTHANFASSSPQIPNQSIQISYDAAGNRAFSTVNGDLRDYASNALNQYTAVDGVGYTYDTNGNLLFDGTRRYTYDQWNRLIRVEAGSDVQQYEYNVFGARSATILNGVRTEYLLAPGPFGEVLAEYDSTGALLARNIFGNSLLARTDPSGAPNYFDFDVIGSTAGLTDSSGAYVNQYAYDPFGNSLFSNEGLDNPYEFTGELGARADIGGLIQMGMRQYSATDGRFTTVDPLRFTADLNTYRYAENSPTMHVDPVGLGTYVNWLLGKGAPKPRPVKPKVPTPQPDVGPAGNTLYGVGVDAWQSIAVNAQTGGSPSVKDALGGLAVSFALGQGFSAPGLGGFSNGIQLLMEKDVGGHHVNAMCGLAFQREFGTINKSAAKQLAALEGAGGGSVNAACLEGFPFSGDADLGVGDRCAYGEAGLPRANDPNDKLPPAGFGPQNRVPIEDPIVYTVDFENLGPGSVDANGDPYPIVAGAAAQRVSIGDQLSANLDWSSVVFTDFKFGETIVPVTGGQGAFHAVVPVTSSGGFAYVVQIDAEVDVATGVLAVTFQAIDPATGLPPPALVGVVEPEDGSGNGMGYFKFSVKPIATVPDGTGIRNIALIQFDGNEVIPTNQIDPLDPSQGTDPAREALVTIDSLPPTVTAGPVFEFNTPTPRVTVQFSEDVASSLVAGDLLIENLTTSTPLTPASVSYDAMTHTATFHLPTTLPDGNYAVTLPGANVTDGVGRPMAADATGDFFFLRGDANRDRRVNLQDFNILATNFGQTPRTFSQGDFNYDGTVNLQDFNALASRFGTDLPPPASRQAPTPGGGRAQLLALRSDILGGRTTLPARFSQQLIDELDKLLAGQTR